MMRRPFINVLVLIVALLASASQSVRAQELEAIELRGDKERIQITPMALAIDGQGDSLRVNTAPDSDGVRRLMSVRAQEQGSDPNWIIFALRNVTDKPITRWVTAARYDVIGSGVIWPDLDSSRIRTLTPSVGFVPQKVDNERADIFQVTINPGQTITYVAELMTDRVARIYLWRPLAYELTVRDRRLFNGIMLGITGLLGVFLTAVFAANHKLIFPSAALVAWSVLAYLCVDFGFWHKLLQLRAEENAVYRAATEAAMAASLAIFLFTFLRLGAWHGFIRMLAMVWIIAAVALVFVAVIDPRLASTFARLSFAAVGAIGALLTLFLAVRGQDRALSLVPTWLLFLVWLFGATTTLTGQLNGELVVSSLVAGLTLIVVLLGFTVTQFAFGSMDASLYGAAPSEQNLRSLAVDGAGAAVWDWHARREEVKVSPVVEATLGLNPGELSTKVSDFLKHLHPADQERFRVLLWSVQERGGGLIKTDFRLRHADNSYRWFDLEAASVQSADRRTLRCVGLMRDVTDSKRAQSRLMHDAVHDSLTNLPNRELFLDRLSVAINRAQSEPDLKPKIVFIDIDKFKSVNASFGLIVGDSLLLTISKRLARHLESQDTLARVGGDQFAILLLADHNPNELAQLAEQLRRSIRTPIRIAGQDVVLTGAVGIAVYDGHATPDTEDNDLLKEAEIAMYRAKRKGADQVEIFRPEMRSERDDRITIESELRQALERKQLKVLFQPIIYLPREELAGFEALVRWEHPRMGLLNPAEFVPVAEESDLIVKLGSYVLMRSVEQAARWQRELPRADNPLFVSVNVSSRQLFRQDLIQEIRHIVGRQIVPEGALRLEITETLVMENPEQATEMLEMLQSAGARLALDDFGTGYSSLTYLQRFPFDTIKIDRDLIQASNDDGQGSAIVRSIVALSHELGKKVVAEGVEAAEDVGFLRSIGCEYAQGFYYGEAMTDREVSDLLKVVRKSERKLQRRGFFRTTATPERQARKPREIAAANGDEASSAAASGTLVPMSTSQPGAAQAANGRKPPLPAAATGESDDQNAAPRGALQYRSTNLRTRRRAGPPDGRPQQAGEAARPPPPEPAANTARPAGPPEAVRPAAPQPQAQPPLPVSLPTPVPARRAPPPPQAAPPEILPPQAASPRAAPSQSRQAPARQAPPPQGAAPKTQPPRSPPAQPGRPQASPPAGAPSVGAPPAPPVAGRNQPVAPPRNGAAPAETPAVSRTAAKPPPALPRVAAQAPAPGNRRAANGPPAAPPDGPPSPKPAPSGSHLPDLSKLPPGIAESLAKLAGVEQAAAEPKAVPPELPRKAKPKT